MIKRAQHRELNQEVYIFMNEVYPHLEMDDEMGGRIIYGDGNPDNYIEYHQSQHTVSVANWASKEAKVIARELERFIRDTKWMLGIEQ